MHCGEMEDIVMENFSWRGVCIREHMVYWIFPHLIMVLYLLDKVFNYVIIEVL